MFALILPASRLPPPLLARTATWVLGSLASAINFVLLECNTLVVLEERHLEAEATVKAAMLVIAM